MTASCTAPPSRGSPYFSPSGSSSGLPSTSHPVVPLGMPHHPARPGGRVSDTSITPLESLSLPQSASHNTFSGIDPSRSPPPPPEHSARSLENNDDCGMPTSPPWGTVASREISFHRDQTHTPNVNTFVHGVLADPNPTTTATEVPTSVHTGATDSSDRFGDFDAVHFEGVLTFC